VPVYSPSVGEKSHNMPGEFTPTATSKGRKRVYVNPDYLAKYGDNRD